MQTPITTLPQLKTLQGNTYVYAIIVMAVAFAISYIVATCIIPYKGAKDTSYKIRRVFYIIIGFVGAAGFWLYNQLSVMPRINNVGFKGQFAMTNNLCLLITVLGYVALSLLVAVSFRKSKFSTIFFKHKK